jgi:predicted acylesterase/phospholipase RssA
MRNFLALREEVAKVKMSQYYRMNDVELSCTSVDLDSKMLRFFNHKTTPQLPVCKAVQMTGSFPVAFKAQQWKKEWGYYYVYQSRSKMLIDLEGHEFTDGGLLANFPIKYMDNEDLRKKYFSHAATKDLTVLLGFGLDFLEAGRYELTEKQKTTARQSNLKAQIAFQDLVGSIDKFSAAIKIWKATTSSGRDSVKWS